MHLQRQWDLLLNHQADWIRQESIRLPKLITRPLQWSWQVLCHRIHQRISKKRYWKVCPTWTIAKPASWNIWINREYWQVIKVWKIVIFKKYTGLLHLHKIKAWKELNSKPEGKVKETWATAQFYNRHQIWKTSISMVRKQKIRSSRRWLKEACKNTSCILKRPNSNSWKSRLTLMSWKKNKKMLRHKLTARWQGIVILSLRSRGGSEVNKLFHTKTKP